MKIEKIEVIPVQIPGIHQGTITGAVQDGVGFVVVRVFAGGVAGYGEIGPWHEDSTQQGVVLALRQFLAPRMIGLDPRNLASLHRAMDRSLRGHHYAKAVIDIAIYDLLGKAFNLPVHQLLGGAYREEFAVSRTVTIKSPQEAIAEALSYVTGGYRGLKIKVGLDPKADIELVRAIREAVGLEIDIRLDANQGYSAAIAIPTLRRMEEYNLQLVEQPVPRWDLDGMGKVCCALTTPVMACESAHNAHDVYRLAQHQAADMITIKLPRPGGLYPAMRMVAVAEAAGLPVGVGKVDGMGIGAAAHAHLAAVCKDLVEPNDIEGPLKLVDDILAEPLRFEDGNMHIPSGPGLGVEVDEDKLKYYTSED
jgi:L-alanine-DL-glutamate epimerase-like enolase superfamily enzyme